eukprot:TRINITY_DN12581_c0_g1_i1.p1 TRINITY_DN12581_c0_g1~~TRINITY_DN12581_c0_g1_i1.p1  ORF type:complete len:266 (-),score=6.83 TRINITY_DN12581_c0_g1_i1:99-896(-)
MLHWVGWASIHYVIAYYILCQKNMAQMRPRAPLCMIALLAFLCTIFVSIKAQPTQCRTVHKGEFYDSLIPWKGFHTGTVRSQVQMQPNTVQYLFGPTDPKGALCISSWNKLYGGSRCGYFMFHHEYSDRFVWRRAQDCLVINGSHVIGTKPNCPDANKIEVAAYAYDMGHAPYQNSTLLQIFSTKLDVGVTYTTQIDFLLDSSVYSLFDATGANLLEQHTIQHTACGSFKEGYKLGLYFGGQCPAPSDVTVCYSDPDTKGTKPVL